MSSSQKIISKDGEPMLSARKTAARLKCAPDYVSKLCREGKLQGEQVEGQWFVFESSIEEFDAQRKIAKKQRSQILASQRRSEHISTQLQNSTLIGQAILQAKYGGELSVGGTIGMPPQEPMLSTRKTASRLKCAPDYVSKLCREGKLRGEQIDGQWFVFKSSIDEFEKNRLAAKQQRAQQLAEERRVEQATYQIQSSTLIEQCVIYGRKMLVRVPVGMIAGGVLLFGALVFASNLHNMRPAGQNLGAAVSESQLPFFGLQAPSIVLPVNTGNAFAGATNFLSNVFATLFGGTQQPDVAVEFTPWPAMPPSLPTVATTTPIAYVPLPYVPSSPVAEQTTSNPTVSNPAAPAKTSTQTAPGSTIINISGVTEDELTARLVALASSIQSQIALLQNPGHESPLQNFVIPEVINNLTNVRLNGVTKADTVLAQDVNTDTLEANSATIGDLTITGNTNLTGNLSLGTSTPGTFSAGTSTVTNLVVTNTSTSTFAGDVTVAGLTSLNSLLVNNAATFLGALNFSGDTTFVNATSTNFFADTASSTDLFASNASIANLTVGSFNVTGTTTINGVTEHTDLVTFDQGLISQASSTINGDLTTTGTNNFFGAVNVVGLATFQTGFVSQASSTISGDLTTTGTNNFAGDLIVAGNTTLANATSTSFFSTTASSTDLFAQNGSVGTLSAQTLSVSGDTALAGGLTVAGAATTTNLAITSLAVNEVPFAGTDGLLTGSSALTFDGSTFAVTGGVIQSTSGIFRADDQYHQIILHNGGNNSDYFEWGDTLANGGGHRFFTGGTSQTLRLEIADDGTYIQGPVGIGTTSPSQALAIQGNSYVSGDSFFGGAITGTSTLDIAGLSTLGSLSVTGDTTLAGLLNQTGLATFQTGFVSQASSTIGDGSQEGGLTVSGGATTTGNTFLIGDLNVAGNTTLANATSTAFFAAVASSTDLFAQTASFGDLSTQSLVVSGDTTLTDLATLLNGYISNASSTIAGDFTVSGNSSVTGTLSVANITVLNGFVSAASSTIGGGTPTTGLTVSGGATTTGDLYVGGALTIAGSLTSSVTNGQIQFLATPQGTGIGQGTMFINPPTAGTNNVLLGLAVNGDERARIDSEGDVQIVGTFNSTNPTGTNSFTGNLSVLGDTTFGASSANTIAFNGQISTDIIPNLDGAYNLGSPTNRFGNIYAATTTIENLVAGGTASSTFIINTGNGTNDAEDATLAFSRGIASPNATLKWNSTLKQFEFNNFPVDFANSINVEGSATSTIAGNLFLTATPTGTGLSQGSLYINPTSGSTNFTLLGVGVNGIERFRIDAEGDTSIQGSLGLQNSLYNIGADTLVVDDKLQINGNELKDSGATTRLTLGATNTFTGNLSVGAGTITSGLINGQTISNAANFTGTLNVVGSTQTTGLTVNGAATTTGNAYFGSNIGIGTTSPMSQLAIQANTNGDALTIVNANPGWATGVQVLDEVGSVALQLNGFGSGNSYAPSGGEIASYNNLVLGTDSNVSSGGTHSISFLTGGYNQPTQTRMTIASGGNVGIGTTSPFYKLSVEGISTLGNQAIAGFFTATSTTGTSAFAGNISVSGNTTLASATSTNFAITNIASGNILKTTTGGAIIPAVAGTDFVTGAGLAAAYPFRVSGNATSTLTQFNGGLTAFASSTIGAGGTGTGLTIFGNATTTGSAYFATTGGSVGVGTTSPSQALSVQGNSYISGTSFFGGAITATSTLNVSGLSTLTSLKLTGGFTDSLSSAGSNGMVLQSTGSATKWVATSTLGFGNGTFLGLSDTLSAYVATRVLFESSTGVTDSSGLTFDGSTFAASNITDAGTLNVLGGTGLATTTINAGGSTTAAPLAVNSQNGNLGLFIGTGSVTGLSADQFSSDIRYNGSGVNWGDLAYYPNGGGNGNLGNFRFSLAGTTVDTVPDAKLGVGSLYSASNIGIATTTPWRTFSVNGNSDLGTSALAGFFTATSTTGTSAFAGNLSVSGSTTVNGFISQASSTVVGSFTNTGNDSVGGLLTVNGITGTSTFTANVGVSGSLGVSGTSYFSDGTTAVPSIAFSSNTGYGLSFATNVINFSTAGSRTALLNSTGFAMDNTNGPALDNVSSLGNSPVIRPNKGDPTTGFAAGAVNQITAIAGGIEITRWSTAGFGIGTSSPTYKLSVEGSSTLGNQAIAGFFTATSTTGTSVFSGNLTVSGSTVHTGNAYFASNVGIGSTTPASRLVINQSGTTASPYAQGLLVTSTGTSNAVAIGALDDAAGSHNPSIQGFSSTLGTVAGLTLNLLGGNVGIGTSTLFSKFVIGGNATIGANYNVAAPVNGLLVEGNVGIGTTSPWGNLSVVNSGSNPGFVVGGGAGGANAQFIVDTNGKVGIGTTSPNSLLSVRGGSASTVVNTGVAQFGVAPGSSGSGVELGTYTGGFGMIQGINFTTGTAGPLQINPFGSASTYIGLAGGSLSVSTSSTAYRTTLVGSTGSGYLGVGSVAPGDIFNISSSGNVGIGTTSPWRTFSVNGSSDLGTNALAGSFTATSSATSTFVGGLRIGSSDFLSLYADASNSIVEANANSLSFRTSRSSDDIIFTTNNIENARFDATNGFFGINNATPAYSLDVKGFINTDSTLGGYKMGGTTILTASSTDRNTFVGLFAGDAFNPGVAEYNTAVGNSALTVATSSKGNVAIGYNTLSSLNDADTAAGTFARNTAIGFASMDSATTGFLNTAVGNDSLSALTTGKGNAALGSWALANSNGDYNSAVGYESLFNNTTGTRNAGFGGLAAFNNTSGTDNAAFGYESLFIASSSAAQFNSAFGSLAGEYASTTGLTAIGYAAGGGASTLYVTGANNTLVGYLSGSRLTTGANNILIGASPNSTSYTQVTTGSQNISIGYNVAVPDSTASGQLNIGNYIYGTGLTGQTTSVSSGSIGLGTTTPWGNLSVVNAGSNPGFVVGGGTNGINPQFVVDTTGKVGIGTSSPQSNLSVAGSNSIVNANFSGYSPLGGNTTTAGSISLGSNATFQGVLQYSAAGATTLSLDNTYDNINAVTQFRMRTSGTPVTAMTILGSGNIGIGTTSPFYKLSVEGISTLGNQALAGFFTATSTTGTSAFAGNISVSGNTTLASATSTNFAITNIASGNILKTTTGGALIPAVAGTDFVTGAGLASAYPFRVTGNATSTLTQFNGGLTAFASSTIGAGGTGSGLTIFGNATTTGSAYVAGNVGIGTTSPWGNLSVEGISTLGNQAFAGFFTATSTTASSFAGGLTAFASSTIGDSTQTGGLTISGGATTTLNAYFASRINVGTTSTNSIFNLSGNASIGADYSVAAPTNGLIVEGQAGFGTSSPSSAPFSSGAAIVASVASNNSGCIFGMSRVSVMDGCINALNGAFAFNSAGANGNVGFFQFNEGTAVNGTQTTAFGIRNYQVSVGTSSLTTSSAGHFNVWGRGCSATSGTCSYYLTVTNSDAGSRVYGDIFNINSVGKVGVGTTTPWAQLSASSTSATIPAFVAQQNSTGAAGIFLGGNVGIGTTSPASLFTVVGGGACFSGSGATALCGNVAGNLYYRTANTNTYDVAERYAVTDTTISAGELVSLDPNNQVQVVRATSTSILLGVISTDPGLLLGGADSVNTATNSRPVALSGRVPVKVNLEGGDIAVGDPITISSVAGVGTKATVTTQTIGIALEPYTAAMATSSKGVIQVFIKPELSFASKDRMQLSDIVTSTATTTATDLAVSSSTNLFSMTLRAAVSGLGQTVVRTFSGAISATTGIFNKVFAHEVHTDKLCVSDNSGETCISKSQLDAMLAGQQASAGSVSTGSSQNTSGTTTVSDITTDTNSSTSTATSTGSTSSPQADTVAPTITLIGNNPATISIGSAYSDLGATVNDNVDQNLGYKVSLNGGPLMDPSTLTLDTSTSTTYTILFSATDSAGNTGTATRTVMVQ